MVDHVCILVVNSCGTSKVKRMKKTSLLHQKTSHDEVILQAKTKQTGSVVDPLLSCFVPYKNLQWIPVGSGLRSRPKNESSTI